MKNILKKLFGFIFTIIFAVLIFCLLIMFFNKNKSNKNTNINSYTASKGTIEKAIEIYGNAELINEEKLSFLLGGEVAEIYVNQGDFVQKGDLLATLNTENIDNDILQAEIALQNAEINYYELQKGGSDTQILQAENSLIQSKSNLNLLEQQYEELQNTSSIDSLGNSNNSLLKNTVFSIKDYANQGEKALTNFDKIFGFSEKYKGENQNYEQYLSKNNTIYKKQTNQGISNGYELLKRLNNSTNHLDSNPSINDKDYVLQSLKNAEALFENIYETSNYAHKALENSEVNEILNTNLIGNFENIVSNYNTLAKANLSAIVNTTNSIKNLTNSNSSDLAIQAKRNEIQSLKDSIKLQEIALQDIRNGATDSQKNIAANTIKQTELNVNKAKKGIENYQIIAPFDGVIRKIDFNEGDKILQTNPKYIYIENPNLIEISLFLDQIDIVQIEKGMDAEVVFDAYPEIIFSGIVGEIDTSANITAGVVSYKVKISIDKGDYKIYGGMTANVKIIIDKQDDTIQIPTTYIQKIGNKNYVTNTSGEIIEVNIGIENDNMTEILSGINDGDIIIKEISNISVNNLSNEMMNRHNETFNK